MFWIQKIFFGTTQTDEDINQKYSRRFECYICHKQFSTNYRMKRRLQIHAEGKLFQYDYEECGKRFHYKDMLVKYRRFQAEEQPFQCDYRKLWGFCQAGTPHDIKYLAREQNHFSAVIHDVERAFLIQAAFTPIDVCTKQTVGVQCSGGSV